MTLEVRRAQVDEIFPLRHAVLRPGRPESASVYAEDGTAVHIGAWDDDALVGCATVFPDPWGGGDDCRRVLAAVADAATTGGAPLLWANARTTALAFYEADGWTVAGEEFIAADTGLAHKPIVRALA